MTYLMPGAADRPVIDRQGSVITLDHAGERWMIDLAHFPGAKAEIAKGDTLQVKIRGGRWLGTKFAFDLVVTAFLDADGSWRARLELPLLAPGAVGIIDLEAWLSGKAVELSGSPSAFKFTTEASKPLTIRAVGSQLVMAVSGDNSWSLRGSFELPSPGLKASSLVIQVVAEEDDDPRTAVEADGLNGTASTTLGTLQGGVVLSATGQPSGWAIFIGPGINGSAIGFDEAIITAGGTNPFRLAIDDLFIADMVQPIVTRLVNGLFSKRPSGFSIAGQVGVFTPERSRFDLDFATKPSWSIEAQLHSIDLPVKGADHAALRFPIPRPVTLFVSSPATIKSADYINFSAATLEVELTDSRLALRRFRDLLNVEVEFENYYLKLTPKGRSLTPGLDWAGKPDVQVNFYFGAQHIAERAFPRQLNAKPFAPEEPFDPLVEGRPARESRVAFEISEARARQDWFNLDVLLDWTGLVPVVHHSAAKYYNATEDHLRHEIPNAETEGRDRLLNLAQNWLSEPAPWSSGNGRPHQPTIIELPYRLWLSPSSDARWRVAPAPNPEANTHRLWSVSLTMGHGAETVRAIWSRGLDRSFLERRSPADEVDQSSWPADEATFKIAFPSETRRELVLLTAGRFLPAILRMDATGKADPSGSVEPLSRSYRFLQTDEGLYNPTAFSRAEIRLTPLGAIASLEGAWTPPSPASVDPFERNWTGTSVGRARHLIYLGRTVEAEVAVKGYLFPLGHLASYVTRQERLYFKHPDSPEPVNYLIERKYIEIGNAEKVFPAVGQPFDARLLGDIRGINLVGKQTPDLIDPGSGTLLTPASIGTPNSGALDLPQGLAFWPRLGRQLGSEHLFEYRLDDAVGVMRSPLMFVDNITVHSPDAMREVVEHYLGTGTNWAPHGAQLSRLRKASFHGDALRYAPFEAAAGASVDSNDGRTRLRTRSWSWGVSGRAGTPAYGPRVQGLAGLTPAEVDCEDFTMNGMMEGADQPPFYPAIAAAEINVQSIDRLTGSANRPVFAAPNHRYLLAGFDPATNPGELFLDILGPELNVSFSGAGGASGGLAHTDMMVVHLSRRVGPVGGSSIRRARPQSAPQAFLAAPSSPEAPSAAEAGRLDPFDALPNAKLLGIVPLKEVIRATALAAAPQLVETVQSGTASVANAAQEARKLLISMAGVVDGLVKDLERQLIEATTRLLAGAEWANLYPELARCLAAVQARVVKIPTVPLKQIFGAVSQFQSDLKALGEEIARVANDPVPAVVRAIIPEISGQWKALRDLAGATSGDVEKLLVQLADGHKVDLKWLLDDQAASIWFGIEQLGQTMFNPMEAAALLAQAQTSLLYEVVGQPLSELVGSYEKAWRQIRAAEGDAAGLILSLVDRGLAFVNALGLSAEAARLESSVQAQCKQVAAALIALADGSIAKGDALRAQLAAAQQQLAALSGTIGPDPINLSFVQTRNATLQILDALGACLATIEAERASLVANLGGTCAIGRLGGISRLMRLRAEAVGRVRNLLLNLGQLIDLLADGRDAPRADYAKTKQALDIIVGQTAGLLKGVTSVAAIAEGRWPAILEDVEALAALWDSHQLAVQAQQIRAAVTQAEQQGAECARLLDTALVETRKAIQQTARDPGLLLAAAGQIQSYATQTDRRITGLVAIGNGLAQQQLALLEDWAYCGLQKMAELAAGLYAAAGFAVGKVNGALATPVLRPAIALLLRQEVIDVLAADQRAIDAELAEWRQIAADAATPAGRNAARATAIRIQRRWRGVGAPPIESALIKASRDVAELSQGLASGQLAQFIDVRAIERQLRDELKRLVPISIETSYSWSTQIGAFPAGGNPIFEIPNSGDKDLTLNARIKIDLLESGKRSVEGKGTLAPFRVNLLGGFKLVSIDFSEALFSLDGGARFDVTVVNVEIKESLKFIQVLQSYMSGGGATGPYWSIRPPLIEVGYRYSCDQIVLGSLMFLNIAFEVAAELAMDGRDARFRFRLASPERPLLISNPPYGGGGYATIVANARGIVGFEASFEFGAVTQLKFGPLTAHGRITAGIYISQSIEQGAVIAGFVNAVGEGRIACFGVSVNIQVRLEHRSRESSMIGTSTYMISFRVGFAKISYKFTAEYRFSGSKGQALAPPVRANLVPVYVARPRPTERWSEHIAQYDLSLLDD